MASNLMSLGLFIFPSPNSAFEAAPLVNYMNQVDLAPLWKALADPKRRRIIQLLNEKTRTTSEICAYFNVSRFAIMRHLKVLEQAELIQTRREGRQRWNFLNEDLFLQVQQTFLDNPDNKEFHLMEIINFLARQEQKRADDAGIQEQSPIELTIVLQATPDEVFQALTEKIDAWWSYRIMADSHVYLEPEVGGRFFEAFNHGGGALYASVTLLKPGEEIRLAGSMGLTEDAINNVIYFNIHLQHPGTTILQLTHHFMGRVNEITVDTFKRSWFDLLAQQLKSFIEEGR